MTMSEIARQPDGTPTGGQFAAVAHPEPAVALTATRVVDLDETVMDEIALMLGTAEEWDGAADYLEDIANQVAASGRPHPGDRDPREYRAEMAVLKAARDGERNPTTRTLDRLALLLGTSPEWAGADYLEIVANMVQASGRPHPGDSDPVEYLVEITQMQADRAGSDQEATEILIGAMSTFMADQGASNAWTVTPVQAANGTWSYSTTVVGAYVTPGGGKLDEEEYDLTATPGAQLLTDLARYSPTHEPEPITINLPVNR